MAVTGTPLRIFFPGASDVITDHLPHGEGLIAHGLMSGLAARGHSVVACGRVLAFREPPPYDAVAIGGGGPFASLAPIGYAALGRRELRRQGGAKSFDLAHWLFPQGRHHMLNALPSRLPLVVGPLSLSWAVAKGPMSIGLILRCMAGPLFALLGKRAFHRASQIMVAVPEAADAIPLSLRSRVSVVPFGIDATTCAVFPLPDVPTILFVGRLDRHKGVRPLLEAFASVRTALPDVRLRFVGEGGESAWLRQRANELGVSSAVDFLGRVKHHEINGLLGGCSLLCMPSDGEPFGMAILEAMAAGRAVVAGNRGGPRHLVSDAGGRLVAAGDEVGLADTLLLLLADSDLLRAMGAFNRRRMEREFAWAVVIDAVEAAYAEALAARAGGTA